LCRVIWHYIIWRIAIAKKADDMIKGYQVKTLDTPASQTEQPHTKILRYAAVAHLFDTKISHVKRGGCVGYVYNALFPPRVFYLVLLKLGPGPRCRIELKGASVGGNSRPDPKPGMLPPLKRCGE